MADKPTQGRPASTGSPVQQGAAAGAATVSVGAVLTATAATVCCTPLVGPILVAVLGVGGAAASTALKPYAPYLFAASFALLAVAFWIAYRPSRACAAPPGPKPMGFTQRGVRLMLWVAASFWIVAVTYAAISLPHS